LDDVTADMSIWRKEVFGPVVAVLAVSSLEEAIELANASEYGLSAALFTKSLAASDVFLRQIDAGQAAVTCPRRAGTSTIHSADSSCLVPRSRSRVLTP